MTLKEQLLEDMKMAMRDRDNVRKETIQMVRAGILQVEKDQKVTLDDEGVITVIAKEVKRRKDVLPDYEKSGRTELIDGIKAEIKVLLHYLPSQLTEEELEPIVKETIEETGAVSMRDMGKIMTAIMPKIKGRADGRTVNEMIKKILS